MCIAFLLAQCGVCDSWGKSDDIRTGGGLQLQAAPVCNLDHLVSAVGRGVNRVLSGADPAVASEKIIDGHSNAIRPFNPIVRAPARAFCGWPLNAQAANRSIRRACPRFGRDDEYQ